MVKKGRQMTIAMTNKIKRCRDVCFLEVKWGLLTEKAIIVSL